MYRFFGRITQCLFVIIMMLAAMPIQAQVPGSSLKTPATPLPVPSAYRSVSGNYVRIWEPAVVTSDTAYVASSMRTANEVRQTTKYFDGLGKPVQTVVKAMTYGGKDFVTPYIYDAFGREQTRYLSYASPGTSDGNFKQDPFVAQRSFYISYLGTDSIFYSRMDYEASPLNRLLKTYAPGNSWAKKDLSGVERGGDRPAQVQYLINTVADSVRIWSFDGAAIIPTSSSGRVYASGQLYKKVTIDEVGVQTIEYRDNAERVILKKVQVLGSVGTAHMGWLCTYYVYDDLGILRFVIPPKAVEGILGSSWVISPAIAGELCFMYRYDSRGRMIVKKLPGADSTEMIYDRRDRVAFVRDGNMKGKTWLASFYDGLDRVTMTALYNNATGTRESLQTAINGAAGNVSQNITYNFPSSADLILDSYDGKPLYQATNSMTLVDGFDTGMGGETMMEITAGAISGSSTITVTNTLTGIPVDSLTPLSYIYYDDYSFAGSQGYAGTDINGPQADGNPNVELLPSNKSASTRGLITGTKVRVLRTDQWLTSTSYYNDKGRLIQTLGDNVNGGVDVVTNLYDFNGKVLSTYLKHKNFRSNLSQPTIVLTMLHYDAAGRLTSIKKRLNNANPSLDKTIATYSYDELGQLKTKRLGVNANSQLETLNYDYNIQGWLTGINKDFVSTSGSTANWFGLTLAYDSGFTALQYNGSIAGSIWKSRGDGIARAYGYSYDKVNRLASADFTQQNSGSTAWTSSEKNFSVSGLSYDANGNIQFMNQKGMNGAAVKTIDSLKYGYMPASNKLLFVTDRQNNAQSQLGDFKEINNNETSDYAYDPNGNLTKDGNKDISVIRYNYLNLPDSIVIVGKGVIQYQYDAGGRKLKKIVTDITTTPAKTTTTVYISGFVYQNDTLQFLDHEEGRTRAIVKVGQPVEYKYDYFLKDHLGNVRMILTEQTDFSGYAATMETSAAAKETALFSNIDNTRTNKPVGYPADESVGTNGAVAKLTATDGSKKIGPSIVLRVMAGDTIQLGVKAFYKSGSPKKKDDKTPLAENMIADLIQAFNGVREGDDGTHRITSSKEQTPFSSSFYNNDYQRLKAKEENQADADRPKAYLNFVLFDDQLKLVEENSGVKQVKAEPDQLQTLAQDKMIINKTGFLYVYTSNESAQDVYFDNVILGVNSGPLLEETHYYPFGLTMAGISANALKGSTYPESRMKYNGKELQSREFSDGSGLEWSDYGARMYDNQIGRFFTQDRFAEKNNSFSVYQYALNNPISNIDINGDSVWTTTKTVTNSQGKTVTTNTLHIQGKVLDLAGVRVGGGCNSRSGMNDLVAGINSNFNKSHTKNTIGDNTEVWEIDAQFSIANSMDDVSESDHLLVVVDDVTGEADPDLGGGNAGGVANLKEKTGYIEKSSNLSFLIQTGVHEIGHNLGLKHAENGSGNFMSYDKERYRFSSIQILIMYNMTKTGALNQGSNSQRSTTNSNNWFFHTSTNIEPYRKNTAVGQRIPLIIKN